MGASTNPYLIVSKNTTKKDSDNYYTKFNNESMRKACIELNDYGYKLWTYLNTIQIDDDQPWELSPKALVNWGGGCIKSWQNARDKLISKKYLQPIGNGQFIFVEMPIEANEEKVAAWIDTF